MQQEAEGFYVFYWYVVVLAVQSVLSFLFDDMTRTTANGGNGGVAFIPPADKK